MNIDTGWIELSDPPSQDEVRQDAGVSVKRVLSKYESPCQVRAVHDADHRTLTIEFRYVGGFEPVRQVKFGRSAYGAVGKTSHRIYELVFRDVSDAGGFPAMIERAVSDLRASAASARLEVSESNSEATKYAIWQYVKPELPRAALAAG